MASRDDTSLFATSATLVPPSDRSEDSERSQSHLEEIALQMRWQEAQDRCLENLHLRSEEREAILSFQTPQQLEADLRKREEGVADQYIPKLLAQAYPCIYSIHNLSLVFLDSMPPGTVEISLMWGVLYLAMKGALSSTDTLTKIVQILNRIRAQLVLFCEYAQGLNSHQEIRHAIVDVLVALINFWMKAVQLLRRSPVNYVLSEGWPNLRKEFDEAVQQMEEAIERVHALAAFARLGRDRSDPQITALAASEEESSIDLPFFEGLPSPPSHFIGRDIQLRSMAEHLQREGSRDLRSVVVWGIGGVGKTSLVSVFVSEQRKAETYDAILWLHSESHTRLLESYTDVAIGLGLPGASRSADHESNYVQVRRWLSKTDKRWLQVFDNVENFGAINKYLPPSKGQAIFTTRYRAESLKAPGQISRVELDTLSPENSLELFDDVRALHAGSKPSTDEAKDVKSLLEGLEGLPLAIEQMAAYIGHRHYTVNQFLSKYHKLAKKIHSRNDAGHESRTLGSLWEMNFEYLRKEHEHAALLLGLLSILGPDTIPVELFTSEDCELEERYASFIGEEADVDDAVEILLQVALVKSTGERIGLHRLVQSAFCLSDQGLADDKTQEMQSAFSTAAVLLHRKFPSCGRAATFWGRWEQCSTYCPHVLSLAKRFEKQSGTKNRLHADKGTVKLFIDCAWYLYEIGEFVECLDLLAITKTACEDKSSYEYGLLCNHETCAYHDLFRLRECKKAGEECERVLRACQGLNDLELGSAYNNLGICYLSEGLVDKGIEKLEKSKEIRISAGSSGLLYVSACHINLGIAQLRKGHSELAAEHITEAERIIVSQGNAGKFLLHFTHLERGNFAYREQKYEEAERSYRASYDVCAEMAPTGPRMAACHHKLGLVELRLGQLDSAASHFDKALSIAEFRNMKGEMARSLWQKANTMGHHGSEGDEKQKECQNLRTRAGLLRMQVFEQSGLALQEYGSEDDAFNDLVANSFR